MDMKKTQKSIHYYGFKIPYTTRLEKYYKIRTKQKQIIRRLKWKLLIKNLKKRRTKKK